MGYALKKPIDVQAQDPIPSSFRGRTWLDTFQPTNTILKKTSSRVTLRLISAQRTLAVNNFFIDFYFVLFSNSCRLESSR